MTKHYKTFTISIAVLLLIAICALWIRTKVASPSYKRYLPLIYHYAEEYELSPSLVLAVIKVESNFDPQARSNQDAYGLMQITENTLEWAILREGKNAEHSVEALYNPETNIKYGCYILSLLIREFEDTGTALAAYNAGRSNALKWLKDSRYSNDGISLHTTPYNETNHYMKTVLEYQEKYQETLGESS